MLSFFIFLFPVGGKETATSSVEWAPLLAYQFAVTLLPMDNQSCRRARANRVG
ncbi:hypothetical protein [Burkholderia sp. AU45388]|uniref:hypothetical protein n=1 Tax=Burkholderia sp. AU45388 TaxID=3059206 RepID=UPI00264CEEFE|nr:hypothetical protein [Burkholderia sp. AU45388]MDN7431114.1 hypothetical protein [Burkholderia sp. AU45388]